MSVSTSIRLIAGAALAAALPAALAADDYVASIEQWHATRIANLKKPDGWLSFAGSGRVQPGDNTVGSAEDNAIVLPKGPARLGTLHLGADGGLTLSAEPGSGALIDGKPFERATLSTNADGATPTRVTIGATWFYVVKTGNVVGWRFRDPDSPARLAFTDIETWPIDPAWRVVADWQPFDPPRTIELVTSLGTPEQGIVPGKAVFERDGQRYELQPLSEDDGKQLFFIIADRTSGKESYGAARFLYADAPKDGKVVIDFNKAYNPPCALSPHVVCPTAPPENRLGLRVTAGEKKLATAH
ncbi:MAG TPA: DUF1684 domain-containing protein [Dokdonella sp.]|uniref:DUF1684 domain-containing protein n=1 Tax=Dokdonella sp. TaxID=2291710 RepID=UPI002C4E39DD|nr:DUF1684 domain-containing protein [Dokdonella sp.]HUD43476.1 DUF1684 domain-containing protein [Dokdonella sp.]